MRLFIKIRPYLVFILLFLFGNKITAQGDCSLFAKDSKERLACDYATKAVKFKQGSRESQLLFDSAILANPEYAWAYYEKSVPYFKRGFLSEGMEILNKAVALDPLSYLTYRAYWFFQHESFEHCRIDLERFYSMEGSYPKSTPGGALDMQIVLGIIYAHLGDNQKAIELVSKTINAYPSQDYLGPYDNHTLGVLLLNNGQLREAREVLLESITRNEQFADSYYYLALIAEKLGDLKEAKHYIKESVLRYQGEKNGYTGYPFCFPISLKVAKEKMNELQE